MKNALPLRRMALMLCFILASTVTPAAAQPASNAPGDVGRGTYLWLSDIHFDPFYRDSRSDHDRQEVKNMIESLVDRSDPANPKWRAPTEWDKVLQGSLQQAVDHSNLGSDTNYKLLQAVLDRAVRVGGKPDFILVTGDFLGHNLGSNYAVFAPSDLQSTPHYEQFVHHTLEYLALSLSQRFAGTPVFATLGNNDAYCGDYEIRLDKSYSPFLQNTADVFLKYFLPQLTPAEKKTFTASFLQGGHYSASLPNSTKHRIVVLNSIPFMTQYPETGWGYFGNQASCAKQDPIGGFDATWFQDQVKGTNGSFWIACHVPPGENCFDTARHKKTAMYWSDPNLDLFLRTLIDKGTVKRLGGILAGHSHMSEFKLMRSGNNVASFVLMCASISPVHKNNPSFRVVTYHRPNLGIEDYVTHYLDYSVNDWKSFAFTDSYNAPNVTAGTLQRLWGGMHDNPPNESLKTYAWNYNTRATPLEKIDQSTVIQNWKNGFRHGIGSLMQSQ